MAFDPKAPPYVVAKNSEITHMHVIRFGGIQPGNETKEDEGSR